MIASQITGQKSMDPLSLFFEPYPSSIYIALWGGQYRWTVWEEYHIQVWGSRKLSKTTKTFDFEKPLPKHIAGIVTSKNPWGFSKQARGSKLKPLQGLVA